MASSNCPNSKPSLLYCHVSIILENSLWTRWRGKSCTWSQDSQLYGIDEIVCSNSYMYWHIISAHLARPARPCGVPRSMIPMVIFRTFLRRGASSWAHITIAYIYVSKMKYSLRENQFYMLNDKTTIAMTDKDDRAVGLNYLLELHLKRASISNPLFHLFPDTPQRHSVNFQNGRKARQLRSNLVVSRRGYDPAEHRARSLGRECCQPWMAAGSEAMAR